MANIVIIDYLSEALTAAFSNVMAVYILFAILLLITVFVGIRISFKLSFVFLFVMIVGAASYQLIALDWWIIVLVSVGMAVIAAIAYSEMLQQK